MPAKKVKYRTILQIPAQSSTHVLKDFLESSNKIISDEPEHFKYGIYFDDGYDYMKHLVALDDIPDEGQDLKTLATENRPLVDMMPPQPTKRATVIKELEINAIDCGVDEENCDEVDETEMEKLNQKAIREMDPDILNALEGDGEYSDLEDNFVEIADIPYQKNVLSVDQQLFSRFLGNGSSSLDEEMEDDEDEKRDCFDFKTNLYKPLDDISEQINLEHSWGEMKRLAMPDLEKSKCPSVSEAFTNAFEQSKDLFERKEWVQPVDKSLPFWENLYKGETEYVEAEVDSALRGWIGKEKRKTPTSALEVRGKISKNLPQLMPMSKKPEKPRMDHRTEAIDTADEAEKPIMTLTDVNEYHVQRAANETTEERRERKKGIKAAKRCRKQEKKVLAATFKKAKMAH